jgi:hypothetical protein
MTRRLILVQLSRDVAGAMHDMENQCLVAFDAVDDNILPDCETAQTGAQVVIARPSYVWMLSK